MRLPMQLSTSQGQRLASRQAHVRGRLEVEKRLGGEERWRDASEVVAASAVVGGEDELFVSCSQIVNFQKKWKNFRRNGAPTVLLSSVPK